MKKKLGGFMTNRDWKWTVSVLIGLMILSVSYNLWGKQDSIIDVISIGSGITSIILAILAIIMSLLEGYKTYSRDQKLDQNLNKLEINLNNMEKLIQTGNEKTQSDIKKMLKMYKNNEGINFSEKEDKAKIINQNSTTLKETKTEYKIPETFHDYDKPNVEKIKHHIVKRGEIYKVDLSPAINPNRYVLVIGNNLSNRFSPSVNVVALTNTITEAKLPTHVFLKKEICKLDSDYVALCEQVRTVAKDRLIEKVTLINDDNHGDIIEELNDSISLQFGLVDF
ncbi:type II toxin-antitoxin system PemK/MazF family toxin [Bacillus altitudinis]